MNIRHMASSLILSLSAATSMAAPVLIDFNQQISTKVGNSLQISEFLISDDCAGPQGQERLPGRPSRQQELLALQQLRRLRHPLEPRRWQVL